MLLHHVQTNAKVVKQKVTSPLLLLYTTIILSSDLTFAILDKLVRQHLRKKVIELYEIIDLLE